MMGKKLLAMDENKGRRERLHKEFVIAPRNLHYAVN